MNRKESLRSVMASIENDLRNPGTIIYEGYEIIPIPAICTGPHKYEWVDGGLNGAIRAPALRGCRCFYCGATLKPHSGFPSVIDAETRRKMQPVQIALDIVQPH